MTNNFGLPPSNVLLEIDPVTDQVSEMTIVDGEIEGSPVEISESSFFGSYDLESSTLGASLATLDPPGLVDPNSGEFDSSQHSFTVTSGTLGGNISAPLLGLDEDLTFDFAELPVGGTGFGTGTVTLTPTGATPTSKSYEVVVLLPIAVEQTVEAEGFEIPIGANGTAKLVGPATIEIEDWSERKSNGPVAHRIPVGPIPLAAALEARPPSPGVRTKAAGPPTAAGPRSRPGGCTRCTPRR